MTQMPTRTDACTYSYFPIQMTPHSRTERRMQKRQWSVTYLNRGRSSNGLVKVVGLFVCCQSGEAGASRSHRSHRLGTVSSCLFTTRCSLPRRRLASSLFHHKEPVSTLPTFVHQPSAETLDIFYRTKPHLHHPPHPPPTLQQTILSPSSWDSSCLCPSRISRLSVSPTTHHPHSPRTTPFATCHHATRSTPRKAALSVQLVPGDRRSRGLVTVGGLRRVLPLTTVRLCR